MKIKNAAFYRKRNFFIVLLFYFQLNYKFSKSIMTLFYYCWSYSCLSWYLCFRIRMNDFNILFNCFYLFLFFLFQKLFIYYTSVIDIPITNWYLSCFCLCLSPNVYFCIPMNDFIFYLIILIIYYNFFIFYFLITNYYYFKFWIEWLNMVFAAVI